MYASFTFLCKLLIRLWWWGYFGFRRKPKNLHINQGEEGSYEKNHLVEDQESAMRRVSTNQTIYLVLFCFLKVVNWQSLSTSEYQVLYLFPINLPCI